MLHKECIMKKAEAWKSVCVSFSVSKEAGNRLRHLALHNDDQLRRLGILSVQVQGEETVKLSISNNTIRAQEVLLGQLSQLPASGSFVNNTEGFANDNDPREFDTILNQIKAGQLPGDLSGYSGADGKNVFVAPQSTKRSDSYRSKEKGPVKLNNSNDMSSTTKALSAAPNGPVIGNTNKSNAQNLLQIQTENSNQSSMADSFCDLGDMHHLDFNDLIGADGSLDNLEIGGKHYNEMVTDILHMGGNMNDPQNNPTLGLSPSSVNSNQVPSQIGGGGINNPSLMSSNPSEHNTNEVDELLDHIQSIGNEDEQCNDLTFNPDNNLSNARGASPAVQRHMSFPQYSSKGLLHEPTAQTMFASGVGVKHGVGQMNVPVGSASDTGIHAASMMRENDARSWNLGPDNSAAQFPSGLPERNMEGSFSDFNQRYQQCNPDMLGMHKQVISRPPSAGMIQTSGTLNANWKIPPGHNPHPQYSTMQQSPGLVSPKPVTMSGTAGYNPALTPTKRSYPGVAAVSQMDVQVVGDGSKIQCMSMASPLLVNLLQTSSSTTVAGSGQVINPQMARTVVDPARPKKKKPARRKKPSKQGAYNSATPESSMIPSPGVMPGQMTPHMSPQHGGARMKQAHFNSQFGMQLVNSPGQYFHPAQSPMPQIHNNLTEGQKSGAMFGHYPNGTNITSPGLHQMGKASPGHILGSDQKTAYIETINRSDVGSRIVSNTPMVQQRIPTPGHSPSAHGHVPSNHLPAASVSTGGGMFMGNMSGTVHHGPRMQRMNGMQMQNRMQLSPGMFHNVPAIHQNVRAGGPMPGTTNNSTLNQQFQMQQHHKTGYQFQPPTPTTHSNASTVYNQQITPKPEQPNMMTSPSQVPTDFVHDSLSPNVVFNGSDSLRQVPAQQQIPGYQKHGGMPSEQFMMMQGDGSMPNYFHQQGSSNAGRVGMKMHNSAMYHSQSAQIHVAGPNNFNNSNNMETHKLIGQDSMMSPGMPRCSSSGIPANVTDATVSHFPLSARPKTVLDSGDLSALLKGACNSFAQSVRGTPSIPPEHMGQKMPRLSKKSPGSVTDGLSSSPGSSHSHTPSPAALKRCLSTSNPPTPLHLDSMGSPTSITLHHTTSKTAVPRLKSPCTVGGGHRPSLEKQSSVSRSQVSPANMSPVTVNGPHLLSRPASRTEIGLQYATSPGTPGSLRSHYQTPPSYPQVPESPMSFSLSRDNVLSNATHTNSGAGDAVVLPAQSRYQAQSNENNLGRLGKTDVMQSPWTNTVSNHLSSSTQNNSSSIMGDPMNSLSQNSVAVDPTSYNLHNASNTNQSASKGGNQINHISNKLVPGVSPQSTDPISSPCTPASDMVQGTVRSNNSPTFFSNQTGELLSGNRPKKQPENSPAPIVSLQS